MLINLIKKWLILEQKLLLAKKVSAFLRALYIDRGLKN